MHRAVSLIVSFVTLLWVGLPSMAAAQERKGFWIGAGLGLGSADASADGLALDRERIGALNIDLGWTLTPRLLIGAEISGLTVTVQPRGDLREAAVVDLLATLTYYPHRSSGFFVRGGGGPSFFDDIGGAARRLDIKGRGAGGTMGVGYDVYLGRQFSLTPAISLRYAHIGEVQFGGQPQLHHWRHNVVDFTIGIKLN